MLLVLSMTVGLIPGVLAQETGETPADSGHHASYIRPADENLKVDFTAALDGEKIFRLPDTIREDEEISIIITLDVVNLMDAYEGTDKTMSFREYVLNSQDAARIQDRVRSQKAEVLARLQEQGIAYTAGEEYSTLLSGFELVITARDFGATCAALSEGQNAIIGEVYQRMETELVENTVNVYDTGIFNSANVAYDGSGMVVAVLDTGLDSSHSAFSVSNFTSDHLGLTYEDVAAVVSQTRAYAQSGGLSVDDVYINTKVPFGYDYADNDPDVYSTHNNHGTHVSGVIVGKDDTITGVAPNAQLVSMKIFSDVMDTARSAWIMAALEDCVILGVDVINMSLGTSAGFSRESDEEVLNGVYDKIRAAGISIVAAASNSYSSAYGSEANGNLPLTSNPDTGTVGSPSTYNGALSVASISGTETPYLLFKNTIIYFDESNDGSSRENHFCQTLLGDKESVEMEYVIVPGVGRTADYTGLDVNGKIALVRRGDNTFEEKAIIAQAQGAAGIIIYNNVSGEIKMNVGEATLAACSISQDDGQMLVEAGGGKLKISQTQTSGPFISDFSSWGPTPDLQIKPEITGHGGNILSAITGGGYDRLSGTSMACPNLAGVVVLLRQYVVENFPEIANDNVKVNAMVYQLLMSTADIALNTNGLPYSVRKQGAGLANLLSATQTPAYITTQDENGKDMDKTKLELGDDPEKTGVYTMSFTVNNIGDKNLSYELGSYVMTEGVSETKTNAGETTVTEEAYILSGAKLEITAINGEAAKGSKISVKAGEQVDVTVTLTLGDEDKAYLDESFANGMYVEGYLTLKAAGGTDIDLNVPYLAFYGDWTRAPLFDLEYYDTNADELNDGLNEEDKLKADAYATRLIGGVQGDYVSYLGTYYFLQDEADMVISADKKYISLSNQEGTIHALRFAWTGMLRNAAEVKVTVTNDATGEVVYETVDTDVRKSYGDGGSLYPANVEIEFDAMDYNLPNNSTYTIRMEGKLDYENDGTATNEKNVYEFPLTMDFEAPTVTDVEFYTEYDKAEEKTRLFAKVAIYDNHHAMSAQLGYVTTEVDGDGNEQATLKSFEQYMTPVYSQRNSTTYVTFELTDHIYDLKEGSINPNSFVITTYDYALNYATWEVGLPDDFDDFYMPEVEQEITLSPNEVMALQPLVSPAASWSELLEFTSSKPSVVRVVNNQIVAVSSGSAVIKVRDPATNKSLTFKVTVLKEGDEGYRRFDKPVADVFELTGYYTIKSYYMLSSVDKLIGDSGDTRFFEGNYSLSMYPSESVMLLYKLDSYFPRDTTVQFESSNENIVKITDTGIVTAAAEGFASVTMKVLLDDRSTYYSETVSVEVKDPYVTTGPSLTHYYGNGGVVMVPEDLHLTDIGSFAFANFDYVEKTAEELAFDDAETSKQWYIGESTITKVVLPEGIEKINAYAFANLTALEEIVLPSTLEFIEYGAFYGCSNLKTITFSGENNLKVINKNAFENCDLQGTLDLSAICNISDYAFAGNADLEGIITGDNLLTVGQYAFAGCKSLKDVTITAQKVKYGIYAFTDCEALTEFTVNASVLPEGMFYEAEKLEAVTIGPDVEAIGEYAFRDTAVSTVTVAEGNKAFRIGTGEYILSADGKVLAAVVPTVSGTLNADSLGGVQVTAIGHGALSHNHKLTAVILPSVTVIENYGLSSVDTLTTVEFGTLSRIGEYAFFETAITQLPAITVATEIGRYAFGFTALTEVTIPDGMTIAEGVFSECHDLEKVTIGNNVTLGEYAFFTDVDNAFEIVSDWDGDKKIFYYVFSTALKELTIGDNAVIGDNAFANAASLESVTLGAGAEIGYMSFYNLSSLKEIDLSRVKSIGDYAFSGDVRYVFEDENMSIYYVNRNSEYVYSYHGNKLTDISLDSVESLGENAFSYCRSLVNVTLNPAVTEIPAYAFAGCVALENIDLSHIVTIGDYAFLSNEALVSADLSAATTVGEYAFLYCENLADVKLGTAPVKLGEGASSYCEKLSAVQNSTSLEEIGAYGFAYTDIVEIDLSGAVSIDDLAFLKESATPFKVTLSEKLTALGDNPFAFCILEPFGKTEVTEFNGKEYTSTVHTYAISDSVLVIDGSLYCRVPNGLELITYAGTDHADVHVAEDTVRITGYAFAGTDVQMVTLPHTVASIGHKAFFGCEKLELVVFGSYDAPILEEEYDAYYYESFEHFPGTGFIDSYEGYNGEMIDVVGNGMIPYYMWNVTGGMYHNVYYGANFSDYVGYVEDKLTMVRPANGKHYETFILDQYFNCTIDGAQAPDDVTLAAIAAINAIPERVTYEDKAIVEAARAAYDRIATIEQQALVTNYSDLITAEQRIIALTPEETPTEPGEKEPLSGPTWGWILAAVGLAGAVAVAVVLIRKEKANLPQEPEESSEE